MLSRKYQRLRLNSKGNLKCCNNLLLGIPVLSVFALIGMFCCGATFQKTTQQAYATSNASPAVSLIINDGNIKDTITVSDNELAYASHEVAISAINVQSYSLIVSGPTNLTTTSGDTIISGANGKTPTNMDNQWGYAWINNNEDPTLTGFNSLNPSGTSLTGFNIDSDHNLSGSKQLVFGIKFGKTAVSGTYSAKVNLSLVATPLKVADTWSSITTMQQMTSEICASVAQGSSKTLTDARDNKTYTIAKLNDNKCWMTQNLTLDLSVANIAQADKSDNLTNNFPSSALSVSNSSWANSNTAPVFAKAPSKIYGSGGSYQSIYGYYYNWCAATAGSCMSDSTTTVSSGNAPSSICPKGWQLPRSGNGSNNFSALASASTASGGINLGGAFWPYVGALNNAGLIDAGAVGYYWSGTANSTSNAYHLSIGSGSNVNASRSYAKSDGYAVRCIAK